MIRSRKHNRGFTLVELMVCVIIFVIMTALLVLKYGNFNQNVLLTNLAYSTALALRTAQNFGLSVKEVGHGNTPSNNCLDSSTEGTFQCEYGVEFNTATDNTQFFLFAHYPVTPDDGQFHPAMDSKVTTYTLKSGATISGICVGDSCTPAGNGKMDILFKRPDPNAIICDSSGCGKTYAKIQIKGSDNSTRTISVRSNGQISVDI